MTETFLIDYFTNVAASSKDIAHTDDSPSFYCMSDPDDLQEYDNAIRDMAKGECLLLEIGGGAIGSYDTQAERPRIGLHVLVKSATEKFADVRAARDQAKATLLKIVSRIRLDCKDQYARSDNTPGPLKAVNVVFDTNIKFQNMSADGNWYGKSFYFDLYVPLDLTYDTNDWI